jgi:hypothetical protein
LRRVHRNRKRPALLTRLVRPLSVEQGHGHVRNEDADRHGKGGCARARAGGRGAAAQAAAQAAAAALSGEAGEGAPRVKHHAQERRPLRA